MAIRVLEKKRIDNADFFTWLVEAFADTKEEVTPGCVIIDQPDGSDLEPGSHIHTADGDVAFLTTDGRWNWVE